MNRFAKTHRLTDISSVLLSFIFQESIIHFLKHINLIQRPLSVFTISVVIIIIIFTLAEFLFKTIMNLKFVRKLMLNGDYIEGQWALLAYDTKSGADMSYSLISIIGRDDNLEIFGTIFNPNTSAQIGTWRSDYVNYVSPDLNYNYTYELNEDLNSRQGMAKMKFVSYLRESPRMYTGFSIDMDSTMKISYVAWKFDEKKLRKLTDPSRFKDELFSFIKQMKEKNAGKTIIIKSSAA
jgi:hypothetical protein